MKLCAIYTRTATEGSYACDAQREACVVLASQRGWTVLAERFDDTLCSGLASVRPGLTKLRARVRTGDIDIVLVWRADRLTRDLSEALALHQEFAQREVPIVSVADASTGVGA
jgi:DNA invertase Pin-like site-specific DNA recombinase